MSMESPKFENPSASENLGDKKMSRRSFLKGAGKLAAAAALSGTAVEALSACKSEKEEISFNNAAYDKLKQEFEKRNLTESKIYEEFEGRFGKSAFKSFKEENNLEMEEAQKRWSSAINRRADDFIKRAEDWKKYEKMAEEVGLNPKGNLDVKNINGEIEINGIKIPKESTKNTAAVTPHKNSSLESDKDINTDIY